MSLEENKRLVRQYFEAFEAGQAEAYDHLLGPDFYVRGLHDPKGELPPERGPQAYKRALRVRSAAGADRQSIHIDELVAEDDRVIARWTVTWTDAAGFAGLPPTGRRVSYSGVNGFRIADGKLAEAWDLWDRLRMWQQLGVLPETADFLAQVRARRTGE
jgi:steroid delta-isomerase-like uncharacterized protein